MEKIAAALGVTFWQFFQVAEVRQASIVRAANRSQLTLEWSKAEVEALGFLGDGSRFQAALVRIKPEGLRQKQRKTIDERRICVHT